MIFSQSLPRRFPRGFSCRGYVDHFIKVFIAEVGADVFGDVDAVLFHHVFEFFTPSG